MAIETVVPPVPAAAAPADAPSTPPDPLSQEALLGALDDGIAQADGRAPAPPAAAAPAAPVAVPAPVAAPAATVPAPAAAPAAAAVPTEAEQAAALEAEIKTMGLKTAAADRFRDLTNENSKLKAVLTDAGVKAPEEIKALAERAQSATEWESIVNSTNASPQQLGSALEYLRLVNDGAPESLNRAFDMMQAEVSALGKALGREVGPLDPLAEHADIHAAAQAGDITRQHALELVAARARDALGTSHRQVQERAVEMQNAERTAVETLNVLGNRLQQTDPDYAVKLEILKPTLQIIRNSYPPEQWTAAIEHAYNQLPRFPAAPAVAPAPTAPVGPVPVRPTGGARATMAKQTFSNPMEALEAGLAMANGETL